MKNAKEQKPNEAFRISGDWNYQSRQLKHRYHQLTDEDLMYVQGKENELLQRIGAKLEKGRQAVIEIIRKEQVTRAL